MNNKPKLETPPKDKPWAMVSNHPFYPSIEFFKTEAEAIKAANEEIEDMHSENGRHEECSVIVLKVEHFASIRTDY